MGEQKIQSAPSLLFYFIVVVHLQSTKLLQLSNESTHVLHLCTALASGGLCDGAVSKPRNKKMGAGGEKQVGKIGNEQAYQ